mmetsp:Transcript_4768/g.10349  ORF Transcript_4768/g.10349 Transcript_4768/m.10349 type:complete len:300 (-) Transcript_4768:3575-4474(-)
MGLTRRRYAVLCAGLSFSIVTVSWWTLEVDILLKQILTSRGKRGIESSNGKDTPEIFFHVHLAKTAGSTVNRAVARRYYGVCGHKGYSFSQNLEDTVRERTDARFAGYGLDRVHPTRMKIWGFHNCAFISHETGADAFTKVVRLDTFQNVTKTGIIPCRKPVDHLLSQCNMKGINVTNLVSNNSSCPEIISSCSLAWDRYSDSLLDVFDRIILFRYDDFDPLIARLDRTMPRRVIALADTYYYRSNRPRNTQNENFGISCPISTLREHLMRSWSYYRLCDNLLGEASYIELPRERVVYM